MEFVSGFLITVVLAVMSALPIFVLGFLKKGYSNITAWVLLFLCGIIYAVLKQTCVYFGIFNDSGTPIPILVLFIFYFLSRIYVIENTKK